MEKFKIEVVEILRVVVVIDAENIEEAIDKVQYKYEQEEIVLDASDFYDVVIKPVN